MPRDGNPTRERILSVAERLMTDQGYRATSADQVIAEAGSSKGAFFHHFSSKTDLTVQLVERYVAADLAHLDAGLAATAQIVDPTARVVAFLRHYEDGAPPANSTGRRSTSIWRCVYGTAKRMGSRCGGKAADAFAGSPAGGQARTPAAVLGGDRQGNDE